MVVDYIGMRMRDDGGRPDEKGPQQQDDRKGKQVSRQGRHLEETPDLFGRLQLPAATV